MTAVRLAPRGAPEHAHHAVVLLEGRAPWTKFRMHLETRRAAETTTGAGRFFCLKHSPANLDPPLERRLNSNICSVLSVATRWWPSVKLARCRRLATETLWAICARSACSDATGRCGLSKYCMKQCSGADGSGNLKLGRADCTRPCGSQYRTRSCQGFRRKPAGRHLDSFTDGHHLIATPIASNLCVSSERVTTFRGGSRFEGLIILWR